LALVLDVKRVDVVFLFHRDISTQATAEETLRLYSAHFPDLPLEGMGADSESLRPFDLGGAVGLWTRGRSSTPRTRDGGVFASRSRPQMELESDWSFEDRPHMNGIGFRFGDSLFRKNDSRAAVLGFMDTAARQLTPTYGYAASPKDWIAKNLMKRYDRAHHAWIESAVPGPPHALTSLYWWNYFGPDYLAWIGRERLLDAPAYMVKPLGDGILLLLSELPNEYARRQVRRREASVRRHLGEHLFFSSKTPEAVRSVPGLDFSGISAEALKDR